jgi:hypothetical protein
MSNYSNSSSSNIKHYSREEFLHLTWLQSNLDTLWVTGNKSRILFSSDNGDSWTDKQPINTDGPSRHAAHCIENPNLFGLYSGDNELYFDSTGGSFLLTPITDLVLNVSNTDDEIYAVWTDIQIPNHYELTPCDDQDNIISSDVISVSNDLSQYIDGTIKLCWDYSDFFGSIAEEQNKTATKITLTCGAPRVYYIENSLSSTNHFNGLVRLPDVTGDICWTFEKNQPVPAGNIVYVVDEISVSESSDCGDCNLPELCICYSVTEIDYNQDSIELTDNSINSIIEYDECTSCTQICYTVTSCTDEDYIRVVSNDLSGYVGSVISFDDCENRYTIALSDTCVDSEELVYELITEHDSCVDIIEEEVSYRTRSVYPGYYTNGCSPEYTEKILCKWSDAVYNDIVSKRYGINICCQIDEMKYDIKRRILEFKELYNYDIECNNTVNTCCSNTNNTCNC